MKGKFKLISTFLIVFLTAILVGILINFYNQPIKVNVPVVDNTLSGSSIAANQNTTPIIKPSIDSIISGEITSGELSSGESNSGESLFSENETNELLPMVQQPTTPVKEENKPVIISSESTMTNKEKREILTELDNTLMELLDVVNKVQPVDETRLMTEESEVP